MTKEWRYYNELLEKCSKSRDKILDLLRDGLQPYDGNGKKIYCPKEFHEYFHWRDFLETHSGFTGYGNLKKHRFVISVDVLKRIEERENAEARIGEIANEDSNIHEYGGQGVFKLKILCPQLISSPAPKRNITKKSKKKRFLLKRYVRKKNMAAVKKHIAVKFSNSPSS